VEVCGLKPGNVRFDFTGGSRGWKGDVPIVRLNTDRIRSIGWTCRLKTREALRASMASMPSDARLCRLYAA